MNLSRRSFLKGLTVVPGIPASLRMALDVEKQVDLDIEGQQIVAEFAPVESFASPGSCSVHGRGGCFTVDGRSFSMLGWGIDGSHSLAGLLAWSATIYSIAVPGDIGELGKAYELIMGIDGSNRFEGTAYLCGFSQVDGIWCYDFTGTGELVSVWR